MNSEQMKMLTLRGTDVEGAIRRCCQDEELYITCLKSFPEDTTMQELLYAVKTKSWDAAFTSAHALKGLAGNMGFVPLMHAVAKLVTLIRGGRTDDVRQSINEVESCYRDIIDGIRLFMSKYSE